jgi:hypothetical protein
MILTLYDSNFGLSKSLDGMKHSSSSVLVLIVIAVGGYLEMVVAVERGGKLSSAYIIKSKYLWA